MGLVFEENKARGQVVVADFVEGSGAEKLSKAGRSWHFQLLQDLEVLLCVADSQQPSLCITVHLDPGQTLMSQLQLNLCNPTWLLGCMDSVSGSRRWVLDCN